MIVNKPKKKKVLSRYTIILIIMAFIFSIISVRLVYVQIYKHDDYKEQANTTSTKFVSEKAAILKPVRQKRHSTKQWILYLIF